MNTGAPLLCGLLDADAQRLALMPYMVLVLVASSDGKMDRDEMKAFIEECRGLDDNSPLAECMARFAPLSDSPAALGFLTKDGGAHGKKLMDSCRDTLTRLPDNGKHERAWLMSLGQRLASASGGVLGFGAVSGREKQALGALKRILGA